MIKKVGIFYHPFIEAARPLMAELTSIIVQKEASYWTCSARETEKVQDLLTGTELVLSIGGDGTILRVARAIAPRRIPILGINVGKLGFMAQLNPKEAIERLPAFLGGEGHIEERTMLEASHLSQGKKETEYKSYQGLNDVFVGRGRSSRAVLINAIIDGELLNTYRADGVIVATATGCTAYSLSAGGPILYPTAREIILQPLAPHLSLANALVLPADALIRLEIKTEVDAILGIDGQIEHEIKNGDTITIRRSEGKAYFLNDKPPAFWYHTLMNRLKGRNEAANAP